MNFHGLVAPPDYSTNMQCSVNMFEKIRDYFT